MSLHGDALSDALREAIFTTSSLWEHLRIEQGTTPTMFRAVGNAEVNINCRKEDYEAVMYLAMAKCVGRKVLDWLVNDRKGLKAILCKGGTHLAEPHPFSLDDLERHFVHEAGRKSTALMLNRRQYRALKGELRGRGEFLDRKLFGKDLIINEWIIDTVWGLNLNNVHLWESPEGVYASRDEVTSQGFPIIYWNVSLAYKYGDDVTAVKVA